MDKINLANWAAIFGETEQEVLFASDRYTDLHCTFREPGLLAGSVRTVATPGMRLSEFRLEGGQPFQLVDEEGEAAESVFILEGAVESHFQNLASPVSFGKGGHNFQYNRHFCGRHLIHSRSFHALALTYDLEFLKGLVQNDDNETLQKLGASLHTGRTYLAAAGDGLGASPRIEAIIGSIRQCPFSGAMRYLFLESRMMELFALQMEAARQAMKGADGHWSPCDKERLHAVRSYIETAYLESFSLKDLVYRFGLNEFKLKKGYKALFGTTVFGHVHRLRMERARALLEAKRMNVTEAAFFIGYQNVSSFCAEFKKTFACSPGRL